MKLDQSDRLPARGRDPHAAAALTAAGLLTVLSAFSSWASCSTVGCNGPLMSMDEASGIEFGYGGVTVVAGALLTAIGVEAHARAGVSRFAKAALVLALLVIATIITFVADLYAYGDRLLSLWGPPWEMLSLWGPPAFGTILTACGGLVALLASLRLQRAWDDRLDAAGHD